MMNETGQSIGSYELLELLGQGGMGQVWRARHRLSGQTVALKTLKLPSEGLLRGLRREIHALARLRHPGVVRILDEGLEGGLPWYAMELLEGQTLRRWRDAAAVPHTALAEAASAEPWWTLSLETMERRNGAQVQEAAAEGTGTRSVPRAVAPAALRDCLSLMRRLCAPLAYLHGEGLVHCDIKPENVLVRPAGAPGAPPGSLGMPVLVDFGLAGQFATLSREALELEAATSGTVAYMAPEQLRGDLLDARADLYALGCILYELLTGRAPFLGETPLEVLEQHLRVKPPPPSSLVPELPPELDALVLRLLEKEPRRRFGYADDVSAALAQLGAEDGLAAAGWRPRAYLYRPGFSGREVPLRRLEERLLRLQEEDAGGVVLLGGESGVGKTRLLMEVGKEALRRRLQVLGGECQSGAARPLETLRKPLLAIADRCRARGEQETERLLGRRGRVLALYEPTLGSLPGQERYPEPAELTADATRHRLYRYLTETLAAFAEEAPLVLLLDDLQWADELTLGFLGSLLRTQTPGAPQAAPLLVLGSYRSEEVGAPGHGPLQGLIQSSGVRLVALDRLEEPAVGSMVGDMLALEPPPRLFVRFLSRQSEGNPFFVAEYLRAAVYEQLLWRDGQGHWKVAGPGAGGEASEDDYARLPLPGSVRELVERRLQGLPEGARGLLDAASVLGREAEIALAAAMTGMDDVRFDEALAELLRRQVLEAPGPELMRFVHDKIREVAYEGLQDESRRALHRAAADVLEARPAEERDKALAALGRHWEQAGAPTAARRCYLAAARQATARYALDQGERLYRAYLQLVEMHTPESVAARNELGAQVLRVQGRVGEALAEHRKALDEARRIGDRWSEGDSFQWLGKVAQEQGRSEETRELCEQAICIARELGDRRQEGRALGTLAAHYRDQGRIEEALELYQQALAIHREVGDRRFEGIEFGSLAICYRRQGRIEEALELYQQALAIHREVGNRRFEGMTLGNLAAAYHDQGRIEEALELYQQALVIPREVMDRHFEGVVLGNLGDLYRDQGRIEEALELFQQALVIHREVGHRRFEGIVLGFLADLVRLTANESGRAEKLARDGEALLLEAGDRLFLFTLLCVLGHIELAGRRSAGELLDRAGRLALELNFAAGSDLDEILDKLRRAHKAFEAGEMHRLFRGDLVEDLPEGLRRWLTKTGQLSPDFGKDAVSAGPEGLRRRFIETADPKRNV